MKTGTLAGQLFLSIYSQSGKSRKLVSKGRESI